MLLLGDSCLSFPGAGTLITKRVMTIRVVSLTLLWGQFSHPPERQPVLLENEWVNGKQSIVLSNPQESLRSQQIMCFLFPFLSLCIRYFCLFYSSLSFFISFLPFPSTVFPSILLFLSFQPSFSFLTPSSLPPLFPIFPSFLFPPWVRSHEPGLDALHHLLRTGITDHQNSNLMKNITAM